MAFVHKDGLVYYQFDIFPADRVVHGVFTRLGGVSPAPWDTLNLGGNLGDPRENIIENRRRIFAAMERPVESLFDVWQVHSNVVICSEVPRPLDAPHQKADAIVTGNPKVTLLMRFADCVPIMLYDARHHVVAMVHAGWKGTVLKVVVETLEAMREHYHSLPEDILAGIGPSIGPDHYPVGEDVVRWVQGAFGAMADQVLFQRDGRIHLDLWQANALLLKSHGVEQVEIAGLCTACDTGHWYSHRGEAGRTGRFGALMALRD